MIYKADIRIMPLKELLDPQGKAIMAGLKNLHIEGVIDVRAGKHIEMQLEAGSREEAEQKVEEACKKLLANPVIEYYSYDITLAEVAGT